MNSTIRNQFPALQRTHDGKPLTFLDGPAGTQVPDKVIDAISNYYRMSNANLHGAFITTQETDQMMLATRDACAAFLNASSQKNISFGHNMTSMNIKLSRAIGRYLQAGDEILITQLDHESNRGPWLRLAELGIIVKEIALTQNGELDYEDFKEKISTKTKLVAMGMASNYTGAVNDVAFARKITHDYGAWLLLDAVHYAPHFSIDVQAMGCDFLLCSAYKFYGPHIGILYSKVGLLDMLDTDRLRTAYQHAPYKIETGTLNHAALAGVKAAIEFMASTGEGDKLRDQLLRALAGIEAHERELAKELYEFLNGSDKYELVGPSFDGKRAPTLSFYSTHYSADELCKKLAAENIFAWSGHFYAIRASEKLGMQERGGVTRMGMSMYSSQEDIGRTIGVLKSI